MLTLIEAANTVSYDSPHHLWDMLPKMCVLTERWSATGNSTSC